MVGMMHLTPTSRPLQLHLRRIAVLVLSYTASYMHLHTLTSPSIVLSLKPEFVVRIAAIPEA
jgi:hypothetical protein